MFSSIRCLTKYSLTTNNTRHLFVCVPSYKYDSNPLKYDTNFKKLGKKAKVILVKKERAKENYKGKVDVQMKKIEKQRQRKQYDIHEEITINELSKIIGIKSENIFTAALRILRENQSDFQLRKTTIIKDRKILDKLAKEFNCQFDYISSQEKDDVNLDVKHDPPKLEDLVPRPPVVAIVGHIDHGKTTLLDRLRKSNVVETEYGRITQHIGAFSVSLSDYVKEGSVNPLEKVTFLDTPGHAAFKNMRVRGALITDIVILVVDATEGPLEQTIESIEAVKKARVSLVVAINKIDKPGADVDGTKKALHEAGVQIEDYGGDVQAIPISALNGTGVENLIEALLLQAEMLQLSADPQGPVEGSIIESNMELGLGKTSTVLVKRGTLKKGQFLVCGLTYGCVKQVLDTRAPISDLTSQRTELTTVSPSESCRVTGWKLELPKAGDDFLQVDDAKRAQEVIRWRKNKEKKEKELEALRVIEEKRKAEEEIYERYRTQKLQDGFVRAPVFVQNEEAKKEIVVATTTGFDSAHTVSIVIKSDVDGSLDAIENCLQTYDDERVTLDIASTGVGDVTENDLKMAKDFDGIVYAYNIRVTDNIRQAASFLGVPIKEYNVVYALIDDLKQELRYKLPLEDVEDIVGEGMVSKEFLINVKNQKVPVAGCKVFSGNFDIKKRFRIIREKSIIYDGPLASLKHLKEETMVVSHDNDCGIMLEDTSINFKSGDRIKCYEIRKESPELNWSPGF